MVKNKEKNIVVLGSNGMAGHVIEQHLKDQGYKVDGLNRGNGLNAENFLETAELIDKCDPDVVVNCVGVLKPNSINRFKNAKLNTALPIFLSEHSRKKCYKLIHLSTNCVFADLGPHREDSEPNMLDLYGMSKALGEVNEGQDLTIRTSITGPELKNGVNLFSWAVHKSGNPATGFKNAMWNGVSTLQLSKFIQESIERNYLGLVHYYTEMEESKYEFLKIINEVYGLKKKVTGVKRAGVHSALLSGKHFTTRTLRQQFEEMKIWYTEKFGHPYKPIK